MASERATVLADDFAAANADALVFARGCTDGVWALSVPGEGWSIGVVLHHIAEGQAHAARWLEGMAGGEGVAETAEDIDRANAEHAVRAEAVGPAETLALLGVNGKLLEEALRRLSDEDLDRTAPFGPAGGRQLPTGDLAAVAARHTREHLAHARAAVALEP
jgi:DinB family protein